jgi:hypothetical protein
VRPNKILGVFSIEEKIVRKKLRKPLSRGDGEKKFLLKPWNSADLEEPTVHFAAVGVKLQRLMVMPQVGWCMLAKHGTGSLR